MLQCSTAGPLGIVLMRAAVRPLPAAWCCLNPAKRAMQHLLRSSSGRISLLQALWTAGSCQILVVLVQAPSLWPSSISFPLYPLRGTTHPLETACSIKSTYGLMHLAWNHNIYIYVGNNSLSWFYQKNRTNDVPPPSRGTSKFPTSRHHLRRWISNYSCNNGESLEH